MIHSRQFVHNKVYRTSVIDWEDYRHSSGSIHLGNEARQLDRNSIVQLAGDDPICLVEAGKLLQQRFAAIDLNLGCPQNCAKRGNYGAWLMPDRDQVVRILTAMVKELDVPVTAKIRVFDDYEDTLTLAQAIQECGVQMLTVHGRTVKATKLFAGAADWDIIREVKSKLDIPVVANGGISCKADADLCLTETGVDAVMSSEALLENPKLFTVSGEHDFANNYAKSQLVTAKEYLDTVSAHPDANMPILASRGHLFCILHRYLSGSVHFAVRERLSKSSSLQDMYSILGLIDDNLSTVQYDDEKAIECGMMSERPWYFRHRDSSRSERLCAPKGGKVFYGTSGNASSNGAPLTVEERKRQIKARLGIRT
jgi:tRNA-dihydrouridine synthase